MGRGSQSKANRKHQRKQQRAADKRRPAPENAKEKEQSGGWMSMLMGGGESGVGHSGDGSMQEGERTLAGKDKPEDDKESGGWLDWLPSVNWGAEEESEGYGDRRGDEDNHVDLMSDKESRKLGLEIGAGGASAELEYQRSKKLVDVSGKMEGRSGGLSGELGTNVALGHAEAGVKGKLEADGDGISGEGEIGAGLYAASAQAEGEIGMKIPFVNARLFAEGSIGGNVGVGGKAEGHFSANAEDGFSAGGKVGASAGVGGEVGWGLGLKKDEPEKGWFD
ncbi:MAG: hypothetical protein ACI9MC_002100 [Kiritimatiellia bacterium]|jgi:hypothetical protein